MTQQKSQQVLKQSCVAITGGIASGKTTLRHLLKDLGYETIDADDLARKSVQPGSQGLLDLTDHFSDCILKKDGSLNRQALRKIMTLDPTQKKKIEDILHPIIRKLLLKEIEFKKLGNRLWFYEASLIFEKNLSSQFLETWIVHCHKKTQIDRIISRNHYTEKEARELIGSQLPTDSKLKKADFQINSEKSLAYLKNQIVERVSFLEKNFLKYKG